MKGVFTSIMHWDYHYNYYHFLIDNLTRLYAISKIEEPKIYLIVPKNYKKFFLDIIKIFLDERFEIIEIAPYEVWNLEKFYFVSFSSGDYSTCEGFIPKLYLDFLKKKIFENYTIARIELPEEYKKDFEDNNNKVYQ